MNKLDKKIKKITDEVLKEIKPTPKERAERLKSVRKIMKVIKDELGNDVECVLGGSVGKNTDLR